MILIIIIIMSVTSFSIHASCTAIHFNGSSSTKCAPGFNDESYERDIQNMNNSTQCSNVTSFSTDGNLHCLPDSDISTSKVKIYPAKSDQFKYELEKGLGQTSQGGSNTGLEIYMTDHAGLEVDKDANNEMQGYINHVSSFEPDEDKDRIDYNDIRNQIIESGPNADTNIHFVMDHCFSQAGLEELIKATPPHLDSEIKSIPLEKEDVIDQMYNNNDNGSSHYGVCGVAATAKQQPSLSNRSLSDVSTRFFNKHNRPPSNYELYLSSASDICYHATPQLTSNLFAKNRILYDPELSGVDAMDDNMGKTASEKLLEVAKEGTCLQMLSSNSIEQTYNLIKKPLNNKIKKEKEKENKRLILKRIKEQIPLIKKLLRQNQIRGCKDFGPESLSCYIKALKNRLAKSEKRTVGIVTKNKRELDRKFSNYQKLIARKGIIKSFTDDTFEEEEANLRKNALELSKEFKELAKKALEKITDPIEKKKMSYYFDGARRCRDKQTKYYENIIQGCKEANDEQWKEVDECSRQCTNVEIASQCQLTCNISARKFPRDKFENRSSYTETNDIDLRDLHVREYLDETFIKTDERSIFYEGHKNFPRKCLDLLDGNITNNAKGISLGLEEEETCDAHDCECFKISVSDNLREEAEEELKILKTEISKDKADYTILQNQHQTQEQEILGKERHSRRLMDQFEVLGGLTDLFKNGNSKELEKFGNMARCEQEGMLNGASTPLISEAPEKRESQCK